MRESKPSGSDEGGTSLAAPLRQHLQSGVNDAAAQRMWHGIERRLDSDGRVSSAAARRGSAAEGLAPWYGRGLALATAALLLVGTLILVTALLHAPSWLASGRFASSEKLHGPRALLLLDGTRFDSLEGAEHAERSVSLTDGSWIEAAAGARVEALTSTPTDFGLVVRRGRVRFSVTPGGPRRWLIEARGTRVEVVGTILSVESSERAVRVAVEVGAVVVRSGRLADGVQRLAAGQSLELVTAAPEEKNLGQESAEPDASGSSEPVVPDGSVPSRLGMRSLGSEGARNGTAPAPKRASGQPSARQIKADGVSELWSRADAARASGDAQTAARLLEQLVREHSRDPEASLGAFTLGALLADELQRPEQAALAFRRALDLGLPAMLRDTGYLRLAAALSAAQDWARLREVVAEYVALDPEGEQRGAMEAMGRRAAGAGTGTRGRESLSDGER